MNIDLKARCDVYRKQILHIGEKVRLLITHDAFRDEDEYPRQHGEMKANIMLTYRHLEDAHMRIGKILQAAGDGVSILDKPAIDPNSERHNCMENEQNEPQDESSSQQAVETAETTSEPAQEAQPTPTGAGTPNPETPSETPGITDQPQAEGDVVS